MNPNPAECDGTWGYNRTIGESEPTVEVLRCSGCGDLMAIWKGRAHDFSPGATNQEILRKVLAPTTTEPHPTR